MRDRFGIFGAVIRIRKLSLLLVMTLRIPNNLLPVKRGDPGRPIIPISIGMVDFPEALCDFGSSVNIMPMVLYDKFFTYPLSETTMCL